MAKKAKVKKEIRVEVLCRLERWKKVLAWWGLGLRRGLEGKRGREWKTGFTVAACVITTLLPFHLHSLGFRALRTSTKGSLNLSLYPVSGLKWYSKRDGS